MSRRRKQLTEEYKRESLSDMMHRMNQPSAFDRETPEGSGSRKHRTTPDPKPPAAARDGVADAPPVSGAADAGPGAHAALLSTAVNDATHVDVVNVTNLQCPPLLDHVRIPWSLFFVCQGNAAGPNPQGRPYSPSRRRCDIG